MENLTQKRTKVNVTSATIVGVGVFGQWTLLSYFSRAKRELGSKFLWGELVKPKAMSSFLSEYDPKMGVFAGVVSGIAFATNELIRTRKSSYENGINR